MELTHDVLERETIVAQIVRMMATSAAETIDQSFDQLIALRSERQRKALGAAMCVMRWQFAKLGIEFEESEIAHALGVPLAALRAIDPPRKEKVRALRAAGYSLDEAVQLLRLRPAAVARLASP